ncbi:hypothetical protein GJAV_G00129680 [Gymnothorax javanicus]|nr:hypothetical protein GJAV_G00129680 [Gymnothorax javanicus]
MTLKVVTIGLLLLASMTRSWVQSDGTQPDRNTTTTSSPSTTANNTAASLVPCGAQWAFSPLTLVLSSTVLLYAPFL